MTLFKTLLLVFHRKSQTSSPYVLLQMKFCFKCCIISLYVKYESHIICYICYKCKIYTVDILPLDFTKGFRLYNALNVFIFLFTFPNLITEYISGLYTHRMCIIHTILHIYTTVYEYSKHLFCLYVCNYVIMFGLKYF